MKRSVLLGVIAVLLLAARGGTAGQQRQAEPSGVTKEQFEQWRTKLSNWGRWGKDDERGALNLITADKRKQAFALAKTGTVVSLSPAPWWERARRTRRGGRSSRTAGSRTCSTRSPHRR